MVGNKGFIQLSIFFSLFKFSLIFSFQILPVYNPDTEVNNYYYKVASVQ